MFIDSSFTIMNWETTVSTCILLYSSMWVTLCGVSKVYTFLYEEALNKYVTISRIFSVISFSPSKLSPGTHVYSSGTNPTYSILFSVKLCTLQYFCDLFCTRQFALPFFSDAYISFGKKKDY